MLKHLQDDGDLSIVVSDDGTMVIACSEKHCWTIKAEPLATSNAAVRETLRLGLAENRRVFERLGLDDERLRP